MGSGNVFRVFINGSFKKIFDTTFMRNIKSCQNSNLFSFFHKKLLNKFYKLMPLKNPLTFPLLN